MEDRLPEIEAEDAELEELARQHPGLTFHRVQRSSVDDATFYRPGELDTMTLAEAAPEYHALTHDDIARLNVEEVRSRLGDNEETAVVLEELVAALRIERTALRLRLVQLRAL